MTSEAASIAANASVQDMYKANPLIWLILLLERVFWQVVQKL